MSEYLRKLGFVPMDGLNELELKLLKKVTDLIQERLHIAVVSKDFSVKIIRCNHCGSHKAFCVHFHSEIPGVRRPDLLVDVDDYVHICVDCDTVSHKYDAVYQTSSQLRLVNCPDCGRSFHDADLKTFNRTNY